VLVMEVAQVGAVFKLGLQVGVFKLGCSSRGVQVKCCEFLVSIFRWSKPPHYVKVNPLGEASNVVKFCPQCFDASASRMFHSSIKRPRSIPSVYIPFAGIVCPHKKSSNCRGMLLQL
jgi:hypothetical protein